MTKPKATTFEIATAKQGRATRKGYTMGGWATHKDPGKGVYFWSFTHLETGLSVSVYPPHDKKASALAYLAKLADGTAKEVAFTAQMITKFGGPKWGMGM